MRDVRIVPDLPDLPQVTMLSFASIKWTLPRRCLLKSLPLRQSSQQRFHRAAGSMLLTAIESSFCSTPISRFCRFRSEKKTTGQATKKPDVFVRRRACVHQSSIICRWQFLPDYRVQPSRYSRCTNWFRSGRLVLTRFLASHSIRWPSPARTARLPTRMVSVKRPA